MTQRVSLYNEVHKGLRHALLTLLTDCARTDPRAVDAVSALRTRADSLRSMLEEHAGHEERWVEPVLQDLRPDLSKELAAEHVRLDSLLADVAGAFQRWDQAEADDRLRCGERAHAVLASFVGAYVSHMSREEDEAMPVLQAAMGDEQLLGLSAQLRGSIPPPRLAEFIAIMLPAMNIEERTQMFAGLKAEAPPQVLEGMCGLAAGVLEPGDWNELRARTGL